MIAGVDASGARRFSAAYREYAETADHRFVEISAFLPAPGRGLLALDKTRVDGRLLDTSIPPATSALARAALEDLGNLSPERMSGVSFSMSGRHRHCRDPAIMYDWVLGMCDGDRHSSSHVRRRRRRRPVREIHQRPVQEDREVLHLLDAALQVQ